VHSLMPSVESISLRMQHMIDLQYETISSRSVDTQEPPLAVAAVRNITSSPPDYDPPITDSPVLKIAKAEQNAFARNGRNILPPVRNYQSIPSDPEMGKGKIFFPSDYPRPATQNEFSHNLQSSQDNTRRKNQHFGASDLENDDEFGNALLHHAPVKSSSSCCLWAPFCQFFRYVYEAENLHRSFCYSAIDGLLTGAGIIATLYGMHLLEPNSPMAVQFLAIMISFCACTTDGVCMAIGHVWSTQVVSMQLAGDRRAERLAFDTDRAHVKGKLVDMLLTRGMLKIDAMSIADTLEGYPDIFVSALVGEGYNMFVGGDDNGNLNNAPNAFGGTNSGGVDYGALGQFRSYGQFNEIEHDPEAAAVTASTQESQKESIVMFLAFALFAAVPGTAFLLIGMMLGNNTEAVSVTSMSIFSNSIIMLLLGIWKSKFYDSNWVMFGIETVVVLLICIMTAFFLGVALSSLLPEQALLALKGLTHATTESLYYP